MAEHEQLVAGEVLATSVERIASADQQPDESFSDRDESFRIWIER